MRFLHGILSFALALAAVAAPRAQEPFSLRGGETIVFFGDSITQAEQYVEYVDAYLLTRFPDKTFHVINRGISSETISGTSEPDHDPRRPDAHNRFTRDIASLEPDVVVACFGMNDGNYYPFEPERFAKYQEGVNRLLQRIRDEAKARLALMTPPPFDPYRRRVGDPNAVTFGYKFPAIDYDNTLEHYSRWLLTFREKGIVVADVHAAMNEHLRRRRATKASFFLSGDAVHPGPTGHWLMAQTLLEAWNAPALCAEAKIDAAGPRVVTGEVTDLRREGKALSWTWQTPLPMPMDPQWDQESIALENVNDRLNRYRLAVTGLPAARYRLEADGKAIAEVGREDLARGLDLLRYPAFPTNELSQKVLRWVQERQRLLYGAWRKSIAPSKASGEADSSRQLNEAHRRAAAIESDIRETCRPTAIRMQLVPLDGE